MEFWLCATPTPPTTLTPFFEPLTWCELCSVLKGVGRCCFQEVGVGRCCFQEVGVGRCCFQVVGVGRCCFQEVGVVSSFQQQSILPTTGSPRDARFAQSGMSSSLSCGGRANMERCTFAREERQTESSGQEQGVIMRGVFSL